MQAMAAENVAPPPALTLPPPHPMPAPSRPDRGSLAGPSPLGPGAPPLAAPQQPPPAPPHQQQQHYDTSLDPAIKQLLDQQAEIQARLAVLLPQKYGPNIKVELEMLRHKLRVLRAYADDNREPSPLLWFYFLLFIFPPSPVSPLQPRRTLV